MSQLSYDVTTFVLTNQDEVKEHLKSELSYLQSSQPLFVNAPDIYHNHYKTLLVKKLVFYLIPLFNSNYEEMSEIIDIDFVNKYIV